jgi:hypothetical protein
MSATQLMLGAAPLIFLGTLALDVMTPAPPPIVVHDLHYDGGLIYQDRTVFGDGDPGGFYAQWTARLIDASTGDTVPGCAGEGAWTYQPGRIVKPIPLAEWVGSDECAPPPGQYVPIASWYWGYDQTSHQGQPFTIP